MMPIPPHSALHRQAEAPPLRPPLRPPVAALSLWGSSQRGAKRQQIKVGLVGGMDRLLKHQNGSLREFIGEGHRALRASCERLAAGGLVGGVSAGGLSWLALGMGAMPAALAPRVALGLGVGAAGSVLLLASGDRSRTTGAAPAFVAFEAIAMQPPCAAIAGAVTVGLLWAAHQPSGRGLREAAPGGSSRLPMSAGRLRRS